MMLENILTRFQNKYIEVVIDPFLFKYCQNQYLCLQAPIRLSLNLYKLIIAIGTIQTSRWNPSNRQKFIDFCYLLEWIKDDSDFMIKIVSARDTFSPENMASVSENFGVGISVLLADKILDMNWSTIGKIKIDSNGNRKGSRPDWTGNTKNNLHVVVEAKGTMNTPTVKTQLGKALIQKRMMPANINIVSATSLNENCISRNYFMDPPSDPGEIPDTVVLKAKHYAEVFSFLGHAKLSRYFSLMYKRLSENITTQEFSEKQNSYADIIRKYASVDFNGAHYAGSFFRIAEEKYLFLGVDKNLVSYYDFISFKEVQERESESDGNNYILLADGILIIVIGNIAVLGDNIASIPFYQDHMTISDIDIIPVRAFEDYVAYLFSNDGCLVSAEEKSSMYDLQVNYGNKIFFIEFKKNSSPDAFFQVVNRWRKSNDMRKGNLVIVTNIDLTKYLEQLKPAIVIDRNALKLIVRKQRKIIEYLRG